MPLNIATVQGPGGEALLIRRIFPSDPEVEFAREHLREDDEGWPFDALQGWDWIAEDNALRQGHNKKGDASIVQPELYMLYRKDTDEPLACASLLRSDMTRRFDPTLPVWVESLFPWRACVAEAAGEEGNGYAAIIGAAVLRRAKELGFKVIYLFVSVPDDGRIPASWRGFPCELVWRGRYCDHIPLPDGSPRSVLPDQMVLAIPLENVPDTL